MADAWYLKIPTGQDTALIEITGLTGTISRFEFELMEDYTPVNVAYTYDARRKPGNSSSGSGDGYLINVNDTTQSNTIDLLKNGASIADINWFSNRLAGDVYSFGMDIDASLGCIAVGNAFRENRSNEGATYKYIKIIDGAATHIFNMTDSGGTGTTLTSDTGTLTLTLFNFPAGNAHWVLYDDGTASASADTILPTGVPTEEAFGTPAIDTNSVDVAPTSIPSETAFGTPSLTGAAVLTPSGIPSETSTGSPAITTGEVYIEPEGIPSLEAFGLPTVSVGVLFITPIGLASAEELGTPEIKLFVQYITPTGIQTAEVLGRPSISGGDEPTFYLTNQGVKYKVNGAILISITNE